MSARLVEGPKHPVSRRHAGLPAKQLRVESRVSGPDFGHILIGKLPKSDL